MDPRGPVISKAIEDLHLSLRWLAERVGSNHVTVGSVLSGKTQKPQDPKIWEKMEAAIDEYRSSKMPIKIEPRTLVKIPVMNGIRAGHPWDTSATDVDWEWYPNQGPDFQAWGRYVDGESMSPILIPGDAAIFENRQWEIGDVVHACKDGKDVVKAIRRHGEELMLESFNGEDQQPFSAAGWKVEGVCVARIRYYQRKVRQLTEFPNGLKWSMRDLGL